MDQFNYEMALIAEGQEAAMSKGQKIEKNELSELQNRFLKKPWLIEHAGNRKKAKTVVTVLQVFSAAFAYYGMSVMLESIPTPHPIVGILITCIILFVVEWCKRKTSDKAHDSIQGWRKNVHDDLGNKVRIKWSYVFVTLVIGAASIFLSGFGAWFMTGDFGVQAKLMGSGNDPQAQMLIASIKEKKTEYAAWKIDPSNTASSNGKQVVKYDLRKIQADKQAAIAALEATLIKNHDVHLVENVDIRKEWKVRSNYSKYGSTIMALFFEVLFELIMCFCSLYDVKKLIYLKAMKNAYSGGSGSRRKRSSSKKEMALSMN